MNTIYAIRNIKNNKRYIGKTKKFSNRFNSHRHDLRLKIHPSKRLQDEWNIYGEDSFVYEMLEQKEGNPSEIRALENNWMEKYKTRNPEFGYNKNESIASSDYIIKRKKVLENKDDPRHGKSLVVMFSYNCTCEKCVKAREQLKNDVHKNPQHPLHGTTRAYIYLQCRCEKCSNIFRKNSYIYRREYNWKKIGIKNFDWNEYIKNLKKQNFKCAVCGCSLTEKTGEVDHDHSNGKVRGILCGACNKGLNFVNTMAAKTNKDCLYILNAISYLFKHKNQEK